MQQADDFLEETEVLAGALEGLDEAGWRTVTQFKGWTIEDVVNHLHFWNLAADLSLTDPDAFARLAEQVNAARDRGPIRAVEPTIRPDLHGRELFEAWLSFAREMAPPWRETDPKTRVAWMGPSMSARSSMTARQMETWAHGQEVFDILGLEREEGDRIRNIVILGVNTYGWAFACRGETAPSPMPKLRLTSPSGELWEFGEDETAGLIEGSAVGFAQAVAQTRAPADAELRWTGPAAEAWMARAQCFAGPPSPPPEPGTGFRRTG
ncbi:MAG: TIGR03084 family metal-binding protein [Pseudomonadota bacterium]